MLMEFIALFVVFSLSYWFGYLSHKLETDKRPVCFVYYGQCNLQEVECYFGYFDKPYCNVSDAMLTVTGIDGTVMHFLLSRKELLENSNGQSVNLVVSTANCTKVHNERYMRKAFERGMHFVVIDKHEETNQ